MFKASSSMVATVLVVAFACKAHTSEHAQVESLIVTGMLIDVATDLMQYVEQKIVKGPTTAVEDYGHAQIDKIFNAVCHFACEVVTGVDTQETKEVQAQADVAHLQADADLKWNLGVEIQAIINQAKKIVPNSGLAADEVIDLRKRLSLLEATVAKTLNQIKDPVMANRAVANFHTYLLFVAVSNWVADLTVDVDRGLGKPPEVIAQHLQAQLDFLHNQQAAFSKFSDAANTVFLTNVLHQGSESRPETIELGVEKSVHYAYWGEVGGVRTYGPVSTLKAATSYDVAQVTKAEAEAKDLFMKNSLPKLQEDYRQVALGSKFDAFVQDMAAMTTPVTEHLRQLRAAGVTVAPIDVDLPTHTSMPTDNPDAPSQDQTPGSGADPHPVKPAPSPDKGQVYRP